MNKETYLKAEKYMLSYMNDGAHDEQHVYRVLFIALAIAENYTVDFDVLIASSLLHDIGRKSQFKDPNIDHAVIGSDMAYEFLKEQGWSNDKATHVKDCIKTHRYRKNSQPNSIEAKILFDSDKLDVTGTIGIARTLAYKGIVSEPLYTIGKNGEILDGKDDKEPSFFQEYHYKLKRIYDNFYTERAREIAKSREGIAKLFYESMLSEVKETYELGERQLDKVLE